MDVKSEATAEKRMLAQTAQKIRVTVACWSNRCYCVMCGSHLNVLSYFVLWYFLICLASLADSLIIQAAVLTLHYGPNAAAFRFSLNDEIEREQEITSVLLEGNRSPPGLSSLTVFTTHVEKFMWTM